MSNSLGISSPRGHQDNIEKTKDVLVNAHTLAQYIYGINNLPTFTIAEDENFTFLIKTDSNPFSYVAVVKLHNLGKGTYGKLGYQLIESEVHWHGSLGENEQPENLTGTTINFHKDTYYNKINPLTEGDYVLDMTNAVEGTTVYSYSKGYNALINDIENTYVDDATMFLSQGAQIVGKIQKVSNTNSLYIYLGTLNGDITDYATSHDYINDVGSSDSGTLNLFMWLYDGERIVLRITNTVIPSAPVITVTSGNAQNQLDWISVDANAFYTIYRDTDINFTNPVIVYQGTAITYLDLILVNGTDYHYHGETTIVNLPTSLLGATATGTPSASFWTGRIPSIAYSVNEKINPASTYAFRVSDSQAGAGTETDIGFIGNDVDWGLVATLGDNIYLHTLYNQGTDGATYDAPANLSVNAPNRAYVREAGVTNTLNGKECIRFNKTQAHDASAFSTINASGNAGTYIAVGSGTNVSDNNTLLATATGSSHYFALRLTTVSNLNNIVIKTPVSTTTSQFASQLVNDTQYIMQSVKDATKISTWHNATAGTQDVAYELTAYNNAIFRLFATYNESFRYNGKFQSFVIYNTDVGTVEREAIRDYFNTLYTSY